MNVDLVAIFQLISVVVAWSMAQIIKGSLGYLSFTKKDFFSKSGGMPSSHTASASAFFFSELFFHGLSSFSILALLFLVVIMVDAIGVRYATGKNAQVLKKIVSDKKLQKELVLKNGHKKIEVFAGLVLGLVVSLIIFLVI
ncbi:divergent PAP2 family protein [Candidatus Woesearchaeota archaeon]|nr:divergent PAP2 family protein [Candidatus Woesearchaeota archaeon]